jgi:hydroxymethylglutaryl-CoA reductase
MGLYGPGKAAALAEVCAAVCLAGELSIIGAFCAGDFTRAHRCLARNRKCESSTKNQEAVVPGELADHFGRETNN